MKKRRFILGGRQSLLARVQIALSAKALQNQYPTIEFDFLCKSAQADHDLHTPLWKMPAEGKGVFSSEFSSLLLEGSIDIVIHSHKDLALESHPETEIIPILKRADQRDILLFKKEALSNIPKKIVLLSSSLRRIFLLEHFLKKALPRSLQRSTLIFEPVRGNVMTRIRKLSQSNAHALVMAKAALDRLLLAPSHLLLDPRLLELEELQKAQEEIRKTLQEKCTFMLLPLSWCPNAPAQGSLAAEIRKTDQEAKELLLSLQDPVSTRTSLAERKELSRFGGGCHQKIGIACLERKYGNIQYLRGENERAQILWERKFQARQARKEDAKLDEKSALKVSKKIWPRLGEALKIKRTPLSSSLPACAPKYAWVSRSEAWPDKWKLEAENMIWTAGVQSLFSLAERGSWVHGCADGLGEAEEIGIEAIESIITQKALQKVEFVKLSHQKKIAASRWQTLSTYQIELDTKISDIRERTHFFWKSASQFEWVTRAYPEILKAHHACGPGLTWKHIQKKALGPVSVYLDYQSWLDEMLTEDEKTQ